MGFKYKLKEIEIGDTKVSGGVKSVVTGKDPDTGAISWSIDYVPNLSKLVEDVDELTKTAKGVYQKAKDDKKFLDIYEQARSLRNTIRTHVRNNYPEEYKKAMNESDINAPIASANLAKANNQINNASGLADYLLDVIDQIKDKEQEGIFNNANIKQAINFLTKAKGVDEISTSGAAGPIQTPYAFKKPKKQKELEESPEQPGEDLGPGPKASEDGVRDNAYVKQFKYKLVPKTKDGTYVQKGSGLEVKNV